MSYQCICFNFNTLRTKLDAQFRCSEKDILGMRCTNGCGDGVCPSCRKGIWTQLVKSVSHKSFQPDAMIKEIMGRCETHDNLCKEVPRFVRGDHSIPNVIEHNKTVLTGIHTLLYQNYILFLADEQKRVKKMLVAFRIALESDIQRIKSMQQVADKRFGSIFDGDDEIQ